MLYTEIQYTYITILQEFSTFNYLTLLHIPTVYKSG